MHLRSTLETGISIVLSLYYVPKPSSSSQVELKADVGIIVEGDSHTGKVINIVGNGAFNYNESFIVPVTSSGAKYRYFAVRRSIGDITPSNQQFSHDIQVSRGSNTIEMTAYETVYVTNTTILEPTSFTARSVNTDGTLILLSWINQGQYTSLEIEHYVEAEGGYSPDTLVYDSKVTVSGSSTNTTITIDKDVKYHAFYIRAFTSTSSFSKQSIVVYRSPMKAPIGVSSRVRNTGLLLSWTDPNEENSGKVLKYRIQVSSDGYSSNIVMESDQREYYFANLPKGKSYRFSVAVVDPVTGALSPYSSFSDAVYLPWLQFDGKEPFDYRLGTSLVSALYLGEQPLWKRT